LVEHLHGKEGVDGSSPSEGSAKVPQIRHFPFGSACTFNNVHWVWSRLWSLQIWKRLVKPAFSSLRVRPGRERSRASSSRSRPHESRGAQISARIPRCCLKYRPVPSGSRRTIFGGPTRTTGGTWRVRNRLRPTGQPLRHGALHTCACSIRMSRTRGCSSARRS
jgi:hypothetical protein